MKARTQITWAFLIVAPLLGYLHDAAKADEHIRYFKRGDVGAFSADIEVPTDVDVKATVFTARASNEKPYLLYIESEGSTAGGAMPATFPSQRLALVREDLWAIGRACLMYANEHDDRYPATLRELVERQYLLPKHLDSPLRPRDFEGPSYIYVAGQSTSSSPRNIVVYENPEFCSDSVNCLFLDSHVEAMPSDKFLTALEGTYRRLRREMPQVSFKRHEPAVRAPATASVRVLGRFQGSGEATLSIFGRSAETLLAEQRLVASVDLNLPPADGGDETLLSEWAAAQARRYMARSLDSPHTSYYQYCLLQSRDKYGISDRLLEEIFPDRPDRRGRSVDLYAMTTGALAIQESLQLEEMTGRREVPPDRDVSMNTLKGPVIKSHPFEEMLRGRTPEIFPVAALIPHDNYYCHFSSISKEIAASDLLRQWGGSLLRAMTVTARDSDLPSRYMNQLCIDLSILTRLFGDYVIGEVAITGGDPFMKEGTDVALIIHVKSRMVFDRVMDSYVRGALQTHSDAEASETEYEGISVRSIVTPDRRIASHSAYLGQYKVNSNSLDLLKLIVDTFARRRKSMAENLDLQYMRTIFPGTAEAEDGFIYLSDSFIRKLLSPRWKIEGQRRIICQNHLRMIANAATMYWTEMRKKPSINVLLEEKYLARDVIRCPDGGTYSLDESGRAFCMVHNGLQYCTAISGVSIDTVAEAEAKDYREFVQRYSRYWSRFFDPIGIRLRLGDRIEAETCILPLIENSLYNQLREIVGGEPVELGSQVLTGHTVVSIAAKLGTESRQVSDFQKWLAKEIDLTPPEIGRWIGQSVSVGLYDSDVLFTFAEEGAGTFGSWMNLEAQIAAGLTVSAINLPLYFVIELEDEDLARTSVRRIVGTLRRRFALQNRDRFFLFDIEPYAAGEYKGHEINTLTLQLFVIKFRLHYAIASNRLILSTKRYVLEEVLDSLDPAEMSVKTAKANLHLKVQPRAFDRLRPVVQMGWQERMRAACLANIEPVRVLVQSYGATAQTLDELSRQVEGVTLRCPSGGSYLHDLQRDIVHCSIHGNHDHPRQPALITGNDRLLEFIAGIIESSVAFRFTEEGIMTKLALELRPNADTPTVFSCSMHPQVRSPKAGKCPVCAMDLVRTTPER